MTGVERFVRRSGNSGRSLLLPDGSTALIRPICPSDRDGLLSFHRLISDSTVYMRYFSPVSLAWRIAAPRIADDLANNPARHLILVVERRAPASGVRAIVGVGRLVMLDTSRETAEFALTIRDDFQGMGLGAALLEALIETARTEGLHRLVASVLWENHRMLQLCRELGFQGLAHEPGAPVELALDLRV